MNEFATLDKAIELAQQGYAVYPLIENTKKPPKGVPATKPQLVTRTPSSHGSKSTRLTT